MKLSAVVPQIKSLASRQRQGGSRLAVHLILLMLLGFLALVSVLSSDPTWAAEVTEAADGSLPNSSVTATESARPSQSAGDPIPDWRFHWQPDLKRTSLGVESSGYLYSPRTGEAEVYPGAVGHWYGAYGNGTLEAVNQAEIMVLLPPAKTTWYGEMPQAYIGTSRELGPVHAHLGRKLEDWSHLDDQWQLGIWQPRYRWDYLHPESVGLTGGFVEYEQTGIKLVGFLSGVYVPERGVTTTAENGKMVSDSPWFIEPPKAIPIFDRRTEINYDLQMPSISSIILHTSAGAMIRVGGKEGPWVQGSYAYKPMNQFLLAYDGKLRINENGRDVALVPVKPLFAYHRVTAVETGFRHENFDLGFFSLFDRTEKIEGPANWTSQVARDATAISPSFEYRFGESRAQPIRAELSYLRVWGGESDAVSSDPNGGVSAGSNVFQGRYPFRNAMLVGGELPLINAPGIKNHHGWRMLRSVTFSSRYLYDIEHQGSIWSSDFKFRPLANLELNLGADILGSVGPEKTRVTADDFIGQYRANDRIRGGLTYVF